MATAAPLDLEVEQAYIEEYCTRLEEESQRLSKRIQSAAVQPSSPQVRPHTASSQLVSQMFHQNEHIEVAE